MTGASSIFGTGGVTTVLPEGNCKIHLPLPVVPTNCASVVPTRSGGSVRSRDDCAALWRLALLFAREPLAFASLARAEPAFAGVGLLGTAVSAPGFKVASAALCCS